MRVSEDQEEPLDDSLMNAGECRVTKDLLVPLGISMR